MTRYIKAAMAALLLLLGPVGVNAATLDEIYGLIIAKGRFLNGVKVYNYDMTEEGEHGNTSFSNFKSDPNLVSLEDAFRFSPLSHFEISGAFNYFFRREYKRLTNDGPTPRLDTIQEITAHYFQEYYLNLRYRAGRFEPYLRFEEKRQKSKADAILTLNNTHSFDDIHAHYEKLDFGLRFLSSDQISSSNGYLQQITPILADEQINAEFNVGFRNGKAKNTSDIFVGSALFLREYKHSLRPHFAPEFIVRYGLNDKVELKSGFAYTTPFKYVYEYKQFNATSPNAITGAYKFENKFRAPIEVAFRPNEQWSVEFSSDFEYTKQRLDASEIESDGSSTLYPVRKLRAFRTKPTLLLSYLHGADKQTHRDEFTSLTKPMLRHKQFLTKFKFEHDITTLKKADGNDTQNLIDPYNIFQYPLEQFVAGTEYATLLNGNRSTRAAAVAQQNYYQTELSILYGVRDFLNFGVEAGYRSGNTLHHFTVHDLANRYYKFEPYNYFNWLIDWKPKDNHLISFKAHWVPHYKTFMQSSAANNTKEFEDVTRYYELALNWEILF